MGKYIKKYLDKWFPVEILFERFRCRVFFKKYYLFTKDCNPLILNKEISSLKKITNEFGIFYCGNYIDGYNDALRDFKDIVFRTTTQTASFLDLENDKTKVSNYDYR